MESNGKYLTADSIVMLLGTKYHAESASNLRCMGPSFNAVHYLVCRHA